MEANPIQKEEDKKTRDTLVNHFREQQTKLIYFIISLSVSSIGFAVYTTIGKPFYWYNSIVFLAIIFWGLSIHFALKFVTETLSITYLNIEFYQTLLENIEVPKGLSKKQTLTIMQESLVIRSDKNQKKFNLMTLFFYIGVVTFLLYYIMTMILKL